MKWNLDSPLPDMTRTAESREGMHICAWCGGRIGNHPGMLHAEPAVKYGLCRSCLEERLSQLSSEAA